MERTTKKDLAESLFEKGLRVEAIAEVLQSDPSYVANTLIERGHEPSYVDLYTSTGPQNRYAKRMAGVLRFRDLEAARASVDQIDAIYKGFAAMRDRRGMHQCQILALTGMNRAEGIGKWEAAQVFADWLVRNLKVHRPEPAEIIELPLDRREAAEEPAEDSRHPYLRLAA
jgi:hypothetical protein